MENKIKKLHEVLSKLEGFGDSEFDLSELLITMKVEEIPMISFYNKNDTVVAIVRTRSKREAETINHAIGTIVKTILISAIELFNEEVLKDSEQSTKH